MDLRAGGTSLVDRKPDELPTPLKSELLGAGTEARRLILTDYRCSVQSWIGIICSSDNQRLFCLDGVRLTLRIDWSKRRPRSGSRHSGRLMNSLSTDIEDNLERFCGYSEQRKEIDLNQMEMGSIGSRKVMILGALLVAILATGCYGVRPGWGGGGPGWWGGEEVRSTTRTTPTGATTAIRSPV